MRYILADIANGEVANGGAGAYLNPIRYSPLAIRL
jgi:hypothetical protein